MDDLPPAQEPLALADVRANLRLGDDVSEDGRLTALIIAAREHVENVTGLVLTARLVTETARSLDRWLELSSWPVTSVTAIRYPTGAGMVALPGTSWTYSAKRRPVRVLPAVLGWGAAAGGGMGLPVEIDVQAGYPTPADVPMAVKQAMHLLVAHWYENRVAVETGTRAAAVEVPMGVDALLRSYRLARI